MNKSQSDTLKSSNDDDVAPYINSDGNEESEDYSSQNEEKEKADNSRQSLEQISEQDDESEVSMSNKSEDIKTIKEEEKKKIVYKKTITKKGKAKEKKIITWKTPWLFDKNEKRCTDENGNEICVCGDKDENCGVFIDKGKFYEGKGFRIINGKRNKSARHSITKMSKGGKNYTFICK